MMIPPRMNAEGNVINTLQHFNGLQIVISRIYVCTALCLPSESIK